jgi:hypothetical protein
MQRVLRGVRASVSALALIAANHAHAASLAWQFTQDEESAFLGLVDPADKDKDEADYPFYMSCASTGDETTVVSDIDAKALGESIAKGDVPTFSYVLDGQPDEEGGQVADIRFDEMGGVWQYIVNGADYDTLLTAKTIKITGVGVDLDLPQADLAKSLQQFKDACDNLVSGGDDEGEEDTDTDTAPPKK